jgi:MoaA/NifB/PqqE/SkfB family radical SAM enzyme
MLREDFAEIFELLTAKAVSYTLNTNGTRITPNIAKLLRRKGSKMVALYGATAAVHDHITRTPGSFEAMLQGCAYLREASVGFIVQLIPLRDNYHQYDDMVMLALSLSPHYRIGASWLYLSACGSPRRNAEIARQRLDPKEVVRLDQPDLFYEDWLARGKEPSCRTADGDDRLLAGCIANRREFHIDPYGGMTFCCFIQDPALRYDLRRGPFQEAWEVFIPSLANQIRGGQEYLEHCASCDLRPDCRWCEVYGYLEHRRHGAPVAYLCQVAHETRIVKENWQRHHRRYYEIVGITVQVEADLPITDHTFADKFKLFEVEGSGPDTICIHHHFSLPEVKGRDLGKEVYRRAPWAIFRKSGAWLYLGILPDVKGLEPYKVAVFNQDHTRGRIYHQGEDQFLKGDHQSLTLFPTDQIVLARVLADREACYLHSSGMVLNGRGLLFVGHSDAGKSTITKMLMGKSTILCDDRNIVRRWPNGFKVHGSWSHGEVPLFSPDSAPLAALFFLDKSDKNHLTRLKSPQEIIGRLLACLIKPLTTADWWEKTMTLVEAMVREIPCYRMEFDLSGRIVSELETLLH